MDIIHSKSDRNKIYNSYLPIVRDILQIKGQITVEETTQTLACTLMDKPGRIKIFINPAHEIFKLVPDNVRTAVFVGVLVHEMLHNRYTNPAWEMKIVSQRHPRYDDFYHKICNLIEDFVIETRAIGSLIVTENGIANYKSMYGIQLDKMLPLDALDIAIVSIWQLGNDLDPTDTVDQVMSTLIDFCDFGAETSGLTSEAKELFYKIAPIVFDCVWKTPQERAEVAFDIYKMLEPYLTRKSRSLERGEQECTGANASADRNSAPTQAERRAVEESDSMKAKKKKIRRIAKPEDAEGKDSEEADASKGERSSKTGNKSRNKSEKDAEASNEDSESGKPKPSDKSLEEENADADESASSSADASSENEETDDGTSESESVASEDGTSAGDASEGTDEEGTESGGAESDEPDPNGDEEDESGTSADGDDTDKDSDENGQNGSSAEDEDGSDGESSDDDEDGSSWDDAFDSDTSSDSDGSSDEDGSSDADEGGEDQGNDSGSATHASGGGDKDDNSEASQPNGASESEEDADPLDKRLFEVEPDLKYKINNINEGKVVFDISEETLPETVTGGGTRNDYNRVVEREVTFISEENVEKIYGREIPCVNEFYEGVNETFEAEYKRIVGKHAGAIKKFATELNDILHEKDAFTHGRKGRLNVTRLSKRGETTTRLFKKKTEGETIDARVMFALDTSGSMWGSKIVNAKETLICVNEAFRQVGIPTCVLAFSEDGTAVRHGWFINWSRKKEAQYPLVLIDANNSNFDGYSIRCATKELTKQRCANTLLIVISDGQPATSMLTTRQAIADTKRAIQEAKARTKVYGIGIDQDTETLAMFYGKTFVEHKDVETLLPELAKIIKKEAKTW